MADAPYDLRDYVLDELTPDQRAEVERYLESSSEAREQVEQLKLTQQALLSLPDEEMPRRIGFVSDKVFEPSRAQRLWRALWGEAPRLAFGLAAVLLVLFAGIRWVEPTVTANEDGWRIAFGQPAPPPSTPAVPTPAALTEAQVRDVVQELIAESETRQGEALKRLVSQESADVAAVLRAEWETSRKSLEDGFWLMKANVDKLYRDLAESNRASLEKVTGR